MELHVLFYVYREICGRVRKNESIRGSPYLSREPELHKKVNKRKQKKKKKTQSPHIAFKPTNIKASVLYIFSRGQEMVAQAKVANNVQFFIICRLCKYLRKNEIR